MLFLKQQQLNDAIASQNNHLQNSQQYLQQKSDIQQKIAAGNQQQQMLIDRLNIIEQQSAEFDIVIDESEINQLESQVAEQQFEISQLNIEIEQLNNRNDFEKNELTDVSLSVAQKQGLIDSINNQLSHHTSQPNAASWQYQQNTFLAENNIGTLGCWSQNLDIPQKWQYAFESVTHYWLQAEQLTQPIHIDNVNEELLLLYPIKEVKPVEGTLSQWLTVEEISLPWLPKIYLAENISEGTKEAKFSR